MAENLDELYGDLEDAVAKAGGSTKTNQTPPPYAETNADIAKLKAENETLKRNMGILYRTAKAELERKDRTIEMLQSELDALKR
jgi:hypothetical protein